MRPSNDLEADPKFVLELYPADTAEQAKCFYQRVEISKIAALNRRGWTVEPNFHFGFIQKGLCGCDSRMNLIQYLKFWQVDHGLPMFVWRNGSSGNNFRKLFRLLLSKRLLSVGDVPEVIGAFVSTGRGHVQLRPGIKMTYEWLWPGRLPAPKDFARIVAKTIDEALGTFGEKLELSL